MFCRIKNLVMTLSIFILLTPISATAGTIETSDKPFSVTRLELRWELQRNVFTQKNPRGQSLARFTLINHNNVPLPKKAWGLYFNSVDGVELGQLDGNLALEQVSGSLFRVVPTKGFKGLAAQQTLQINFFQTGVVPNSSKAPNGPYLVFDDAPERGLAIDRYQIMPLLHPEQIDKGVSDPVPVITAQAVFERNAGIDDIALSALPPIFPTPQLLQAGAGRLLLTSMPKIIASTELAAEAALAKTLLQPHFHTPQVNESAPTLSLIIGKIPGQASIEAYEMNIDAIAGISIKGQSSAGVMYGLQSLRDLLPLKPKNTDQLELTARFVSDAPRFEYRGFQLDVARNFHSKETVCRLLDLMARYKLNKFHFHLSDDEGWRLDIAGIPELTSIGAVRGHTLQQTQHLQPAYGSGPTINDPHGSGFYTRADYIDILKYAAALHIEVIPEIEMPGHARAAIKAMEIRFHRLKNSDLTEARRYLLNDMNDRSHYKSAQQYKDNVLDPGLASSYVFIEQVVTQLVALHQEAGVALKTIHVGADELPEGAWEKSPASLATMKRLKLTSTAGLWDYFYHEVDLILRKHGLFASGWEELGAKKNNPQGKSTLIPNPLFIPNNFNLFVWNNTEGAEDFAYRLANAGYKTVLAPVTKMYFDMAYNKNPEEPGVNWGGYVDLDTVYDFIPLDYLKNSEKSLVGKDSLTEEGKKNILGLEATLFTETVRDSARIDYMIMPRLLALAERAWASDPEWATEPTPAKAAAMHRLAWSGFVNQLGKRVLPRIDAEQDAVQYRIAPPGLKRIDKQIHVNYQLPGFTLRYTTDGSEPDTHSALVLGPITAKGLILVAAFDRNGRKGNSSRIENKQ